MFGGTSELVKVFWGAAYLTALLGSFALEAAAERVQQLKEEQ